MSNKSLYRATAAIFWQIMFTTLLLLQEFGDLEGWFAIVILAFSLFASIEALNNLYALERLSRVGK